MKKKINHKQRKIFLMLIVIFITAVVLAVETYAWFVGLSTVDTNSFSISVSSGSGLEISMDGEHWHKDDDVLVVNAQTIAGTSTDYPTSNAYSNNTNSWVNDGGLVPVSSSGILDSVTGRLYFFEKSSLSSTDGGYRLIADPIDHTSGEAGKYVAFDIFIRNGTENVYDNTNYDGIAAENVYLTKTSSATVNGSTGYGAANSVRVGFFMLAGMKSYGAQPSTIRGLSCSSITSTETNIKSICPSNGLNRGLYWNVWEPNHTSHTTAASNYFTGVCRTRNSDGTYNTGTSCAALSSSTVTYPIYTSIAASDNVDIYDGLNGWSGHIYTGNVTTGKLLSLTTYKTPGSSSEYTATSQLFKLAGNSITRVRVYIWLEGQDPDNYDIIAGDNNVTVNFGLTKDRYELKPQYVYSVNTSYSYIGQAAQGRTYGTFYDVKKASNNPTANAVVINNGLITEEYTAFEKDGEVYYLRGAVNESSSTSKPIYEENKTTLRNAFGSTNCSDNTNFFSCSSNGLNAFAYMNGSVSASYSSRGCDVNGAGYAYCHSA